MTNIPEESQNSIETAVVWANQTKDVIWALDMDLAFTYVSQGSAELSGYEPHEIHQMSVGSILTDSSKQLIERALEEAMKLEKEVGPEGYEAPPLELELVRKDMQKVWVEVSRKFMRDEDGNPIGIIGIARDISQRKLAEQKYKHEKMLVEFYNNLLAHDLGNIHYGIMANLELALELDIPDDIAEFVRGALALTKRSVRLTTDVKKLAKLAAEGDLVETDPQLAMNSAIQMVRHAFPTRSIRVNTDIHKKANSLVYADIFLVDVFFNLLHNAVRLDRHERVVIDIETSQTTDSKFVKFEIIDRGPGLNDDSKRMLFAPIEEFDDSIRGLGLTLVKQVIDRYEGQIAVEDRIKGKYRRGARFIVWIPSANE